MRIKSLLAAALILVCGSVFAQDKPSAEANHMAAMMEAMTKAGTPGDPHKRLEAFVGTWNTKMTFWMMPGVPPMSIEGTAENRWAMGGRVLEQRFKGNMMGQTFEGLGFTGYDNVKKQYWGSWVDNMSTSLTTSTGWAPDGKTFLFTGSYPDPMTGKDTRMEERITITDNDHHTMEMWGPGPDGTLFKSMEIQFTRKK